MAGIEISELPAIASANLTDVLPTDQLGPVTGKVSNAQLLTLFQANGAALSETNDTNVTLTLGGSPSTALLNATSITAGWSGQLSPARGGTGINNGASTLTLGGNLQTSGAFNSVFTMTAATSVTFPTSGTLATTSQIPSVTPAALSANNDTNVTITLGGSPSTALLQASSITLGWTGTLAVGRGGTGVSSVTTTPTATSFAGWDANSNFSANSFLTGYQTIATAAGTTALTVSSPYITQFTGSTTQTVTMPLVSTLVRGQRYLIVNSSTGVLTINSSGGNLIQTMASGTSLLLYANAITGTTASSWTVINYQVSDATYPLSLSLGGTNAALTASNGGIFYSTASSGAILAGTATANQVLLSGSSTTPAWSTATYPATTTINQLLYSSSANTIGGITAAANGVLISSNSNVPSWLANSATAGYVLTANSGAPPSWQTVDVSGITIVDKQVFTASGTYTPTSGMKYCIIEVVGGGGAGGGSSSAASSSFAASAGGGGSGGYSVGTFTATTIGSSQTVTIGPGGTGASNAVGGAGTASSVGALISANGGAGGLPSTASTLINVAIGGAGATVPAGSFIKFPGNPGSPGFALVGGDGSASGMGGSSFFGGGAIGIDVDGTSAPGNSAVANTGSGGSGSALYATTGANQAGGNGGSGIVIITEYC
jgi:hypothetical protein